MISRFTRKPYTPIGLDVGTRSVKLVQFSADHQRLIDASRCEWNDLRSEITAEQRAAQLADGIRRAWEGRNFRGRDVVMCLSHEELFLQNIRVPSADRELMDRTLQQEAAGRIPFPVAEAEIRYLEAADIRQGDTVVREVILLACHRPVLDRAIDIVESANLRPVAIDIEPAALLRSSLSQYRRDEERKGRTMLVDIGHAATSIVIAEDDDVLFLKYLELAGQQFDEAVARSLRMEVLEASSIRKHHGDRRSDRQDPEIARSVADATRPVTEKLIAELSMCVRYHSVTFRGQPLSRLMLSGGEANAALAELLAKRLGIPCDVSDPFRAFPTTTNGGRKGQWVVAAGLALREMN